MRQADEGGGKGVRCGVQPVQRDDETEIICEAEVIDERWVTDSGGHREYRPVILTEIVVGDLSYEIELTLTPRDKMRFRMLLGRTAMKGKIVVDPGRSYLAGK